MNRETTVLKIVILLLVSLTAHANDELTVYTVNYPLAYFAQRIGAEHVHTVYPAPPDIDPAFWQPDSADIAGFQQADLILLNGAGYAKWLDRASLPQRKLANTSVAFQHDTIRVEAAVTHQHGPGGEHSHAGTAFTTWLDFSQAVEQARAVKQALVKKRPQHAQAFTHNFRLLEQELVSLDEHVKNVVSRKPDMALLASHPVYQYLARRYKINLKSVLWEPDSIPDQAQWQALQHLLRTHQAKWMLWEGTPEPQSVKRLEAAGIGSLIFDPCANTPEAGDFISVMKRNIMELEKAYRD
jgi:zinc transport system substrate-binding protein